jgi:hypothetical protein
MCLIREEVSYQAFATAVAGRRTAIPMFLTRDNLSASTGSRFWIMASCDNVSGEEAAASRLGFHESVSEQLWYEIID